jgi:LmbE family N-acetylglucosaminyl deacetylase
MGDLDDGPDQTPLANDEIKTAIKSLMPSGHFDLVITHSPAGEYTRHRRHEEIGKAVIQLWHEGEIGAAELWAFAYEDGGRQYLPKAIPAADLYFPLTDEVWKQKYAMINTEYNFASDSWEARTTPDVEAFWRFTNPRDAMSLLTQKQKS